MACELNLKKGGEGEKKKNQTHTITTDGSFHGWSPVLPVGMCRFRERGVVITCVPVTAPVGKQVYFYQCHIAKEM